jgi:membrane protein required for colicin V production
MAFDLFVVLLIAGGVVLGFARGAIRQALALAAWPVTFLLAANLSPSLGRWLVSQAPTYSTEYGVMLAFGAVFTLLFVAAVIIFEVTGTSMTISRNTTIDSLVGAVFGALLAGLTVISIIVVLDSYYAVTDVPGNYHIELLGDVFSVSRESFIAEALRDSVIPLLGDLLAVLLPDNVRAVMR